MRARSRRHLDRSRRRLRSLGRQLNGCRTCHRVFRALLAHHPTLQSATYRARAEERVSILSELLRAAAMPYVQVGPDRVGAGFPDLEQVPAFLPTSQQVYGGIGAGATFSSLQALSAIRPRP
ncbi:MAG: hypothetical protein JWN58_1996 [Gammaproteobacteria bacterium]|nr:hypothetical protein [Gammaproteobacteria bacterium]